MPSDVIKVVAAADYSIVAEFATGEVRRFDVRSYVDFPTNLTRVFLGVAG